ncbi:MAG: MoxR family ATPase [Gammaproteobacteria bacterium]|nr:MAG: MoxR family ATPase [Gammaproteobacteria bacterium]
MSDTREAVQRLRTHIQSRIIGQEMLIDRLLVALLADGHLLVEGAPGLAKTRAIKALADGIEAGFHRIQFTPDLLPGDLTGTDIYHPETAEFSFRPGPLFHNLVLADEINRAPAKVQSALLEAMAERQITVGRKTYRLPELFLVMATQNPIEQEGTYPLPEAQLDRFLLHVRIDYPTPEQEKRILALTRNEALSAQADAPPPVPQQHLLEARREVLQTHLADELEEYIVQLVLATRQPELHDPQLKGRIQYGGSPRASIALDRCSRALAWLRGRDFVTPDDIQSLAFDSLRHRVLLSYEAEAEGLTPDSVIERLLEVVPVP